MLETVQTSASIRGKSSGTTKGASVNNRLKEWDKKMIQMVTAEIVHPISIYEEIGLLSITGAQGENYTSRFSI